jgi:hypothetical protein
MVDVVEHNGIQSEVAWGGRDRWHAVSVQIAGGDLLGGAGGDYPPPRLRVAPRPTAASSNRCGVAV